MFNDYKIEIYKLDKSNIEVDRHGIIVPKYIYVDSFMVDIQPVSNKRVLNVYGNYTNYSYEVFLDYVIKDLNTDDYKIKYDGVMYDILSFTVWLGLPSNRTQLLIGKNI